MIFAAVTKSLIQQVDKLVLYTINRRIPASFGQSHQDAPTLEAVLAATRVNRRKTAVYALTAPGEHTIWLDTPLGEIHCHARVRPALSPRAPLLLYHHGLSEIPYYSSWQRIFPRDTAVPAHVVCVQAPFHNHLREPLQEGFASIAHVYQMFAGSLRVMEAVQEQFEREGAAFTVASGVSWGGVTSILYESLFQRTRAIAPMYASPDLAQVMWHTAELFGRPLAVPRAVVDEFFDLTPYYGRCAPQGVFPLLGEHDQFFPFDHHAQLFRAQHTEIATVPSGHVGGPWTKRASMRQHLLDVLQRATTLDLASVPPHAA